MGYTEVGPPWRGSAEEGWAAVKLLDGGRLGADLLLEGETGSGRRERRGRMRLVFLCLGENNLFLGVLQNRFALFFFISVSCLSH